MLSDVKAGRQLAPAKAAQRSKQDCILCFPFCNGQQGPNPWRKLLVSLAVLYRTFHPFLCCHGTVNLRRTQSAWV